MLIGLVKLNYVIQQHAGTAFKGDESNILREQHIESATY